ncbi:hypothetical protein [Marinobacter sp.]|uniref:hypothetical protein n=1 Tax=Marinobacter sp. TaxID=50741 RepID=UPI00356908F9
MNTLSLEDRIQHSKKVMAGYPEWVKNSSRFQGGGVVRDRSEINEEDKKKVVSSIGKVD